MSLNNAAADAALDVYVAGLSPAPADPAKTKTAMRGLFRAIFSGIASNAVVNPGTMTSDGDPVIGTGTIT